MGIREVTKHLKLNKLKGVILAPNCEKIESKGGLDDAINTIIQIAIEQNVPFVFALGRKSLGKAVNKLVPISVVGIFDYSGAEVRTCKKLINKSNWYLHYLKNNSLGVFQEISRIGQSSQVGLSRYSWRVGKRRMRSSHITIKKYK